MGSHRKNLDAKNPLAAIYFRIAVVPVGTRCERPCGSRAAAGGQMEKLPTVGKFHSEPPSRFTSFDHFVGAREQRRRNFEAEHPGALGVDHQL